MPQDPNLYGQPLPKRQKKAMDLSSSLAFTSQVTALLSANSPAGAAPARSRPSRTKPDLFAEAKAKRKAGARGPAQHEAAARAAGKLSLREPRDTEEDKAERARARRIMEEKARRYAAMQRGDYVAQEGEAGPLVDFDRKWAQRHEHDGEVTSSSGEDASSGDDDDDGNHDGDDDEIIEFEDDLGRTRRGTRRDQRRLERRLARARAAAAELDEMAALPRAAPEGLIVGDVVQSEAFLSAAGAGAADQMEALAARRDRSPTPPEDWHYEAAREVRARGVGFYAFSAGDEEARRREMAALEAERAATEAARREREERLAARRREVEERRRAIGQKRAQKLAESFLDGLGESLAGGGGAGEQADGRGTQEKGQDGKDAGT